MLTLSRIRAIDRVLMLTLMLVPIEASRRRPSDRTHLKRPSSCYLIDQGFAALPDVVEGAPNKHS